MLAYPFFGDDLVKGNRWNLIYFERYWINIFLGIDLEIQKLSLGWVPIEFAFFIYILWLFDEVARFFIFVLSISSCVAGIWWNWFGQGYENSWVFDLLPIENEGHKRVDWGCWVLLNFEHTSTYKLQITRFNEIYLSKNPILTLFPLF